MPKLSYYSQYVKLQVTISMVVKTNESIKKSLVIGKMEHTHPGGYQDGS